METFEKPNQSKITWQALNHTKDEKSPDWFWVVGIIAIGIAVLAIFFSNILLAILILLATFTAFLTKHAEPKMTTFEINRKGVQTGEILHPYASLESFYLIDEDGFDRDRILLKSKKIFMPYIVVPLVEGLHYDNIREYLLEYLNEEQLDESIAFKIMTHLGF